MLQAKNHRFLNTLQRLVDILPVRNLNTRPDQFYPYHDLLKENEDLFPLVAQLYISKTNAEAKSKFDEILSKGRDADSARKVFYVIYELFICGDTRFANLMANIVDTIGRTKFGKRMNWFQEQLFCQDMSWNHHSDAYYFFVDNFSDRALTADNSFFDGLMRC